MLEASLGRLRARVPETPIAAILLTRLLLNIGRGMAGMLEQRIRPFGLAEAEFRVLTAQPAAWRLKLARNGMAAC